MITTPSGLQYEDTTVGTGAVATAGQHVQVHYTGWLYLSLIHISRLVFCAATTCSAVNMVILQKGELKNLLRAVHRLFAFAALQHGLKYRVFADGCKCFLLRCSKIDENA